MDIIEKNSSNYVNREDTGKTNHVQNELERRTNKLAEIIKQR
jgi:hypothetical protein